MYVVYNRNNEFDKSRHCVINKIKKKKTMNYSYTQQNNWRHIQLL